MSTQAALELRGLNVEVSVGRRQMLAVRGVDMRIEQGQIVGLIGESGSGKTLALRAALGLLPPGCRVAGGTLTWRGEDLRAASAQRWRQLRRSELVYVPADTASLNPVYRLEDQLAEALDGGLRPFATGRLSESIQRSLAAVGLGRTSQESLSISRRYPHQLSGGMRQRALIAMAVERQGAILVADEPTSGLDMTTQRQVLGLLSKLRDTTGLGLLVTSHDLDLVGAIADVVVVMYGGQVVESGPRDSVLGNPRHPYTHSLLACMPARGVHSQRLATIGGAPPRLEELGSGCAFRPRCPRYRELGSPSACEINPNPADSDSGTVRCHFAGSTSIAGVRA